LYVWNFFIVHAGNFTGQNVTRFQYDHGVPYIVVTSSSSSSRHTRIWYYTKAYNLSHLKTKSSFGI